jgi:hypothetical protein
MTPPPLLLTSAVIVGDDKSVKLIDPKKRVEHALESIGRWLDLQPNLEIVICDGSGYDYTKLLRGRFSKNSIEALSLSIPSALIQKYGKGYGEGEIIKHALKFSQILPGSTYFAKCTSKLWVNNFKSCLRQWNGVFLCYGKFQNVFSIRETTFNEVDTRFYITSRDYYDQNLKNLHLGILEKSPDGIEVMFKNHIVKSKSEKVLFRTPPIIGGMGGGSGRYYNASLTRHYKERLRTSFLRLDRRWRTLFV